MAGWLVAGGAAQLLFCLIFHALGALCTASLMSSSLLAMASNQRLVQLDVIWKKQSVEMDLSRGSGRALWRKGGLRESGMEGFDIA